MQNFKFSMTDCIQQSHLCVQRTSQPNLNGFSYNLNGFFSLLTLFLGYFVAEFESPIKRISPMLEINNTYNNPYHL